MRQVWTRQLAGIIKIETGRTLRSRISIWLYLLAAAPVLLLAAHSAVERRNLKRLEAIAQANPIGTERLDDLYVGMDLQQVLDLLGRPYARWGRPEGRMRYKYTDGKTDMSLLFQAGRLTRIDTASATSLQQTMRLLASLFNWYFLRVAVFFGSVAIFTNLVRGQILDKTLHLYMLCPVRRELLMMGKYLAALAVTAAVFNLSILLQWSAVLWRFDGAAIRAYFSGIPWHTLGTYMAVTTIACMAYGAVFLVVGLLFRNGVVLTMAILGWEHINQFLPGMLRRLGVVYYLQSLCPATLQTDYMPPLVALLVRPAEPATPASAVFSVLLVTAVVLGLSAVLARRLQVNYAKD